MKRIDLCEFCGKLRDYFENEDQFKNHTCRNKHDIFCKMCEKSFASPLILRRHIESVHKGMAYKCTLCGKSLTSMAAMKRHERTHLERKDHKCDICHNEFSRKEHLSKHRKSCTAKIFKLFKIHRPSNLNHPYMCIKTTGRHFTN